MRSLPREISRLSRFSLSIPLDVIVMGASKRSATHEVVDVGDRQAECMAILKHAAALVKSGQVIGLVLLVELPLGAYRASMTGTDNVAERLGRCDLLHAHVMREAKED